MGNRQKVSLILTKKKITIVAIAMVGDITIPTMKGRIVVSVTVIVTVTVTVTV